MMFRLLPAAAMTATALAAMTAGAATVDVYGVVDTGLHYVKADSGDTSVTMDSGISKGSRVGLIGSEDLGGGYKIVFNLETGFSLDDGSFDNTKNRLFNRNAYLGVDSPYGEVRFGQQGALGSGVNGSIFLNSYTVFGNLYKEAQALQIINHQVMRADNMIRYESPDMARLERLQPRRLADLQPRHPLEARRPDALRRLSVRPQRREGGQPDDALQGHQKYPVRQ